MWSEIFEVMFFGGFDIAWITKAFPQTVWTDIMALGALGIVLFIIFSGAKDYRTNHVLRR